MNAVLAVAAALSGWLAPAELAPWAGPASALGLTLFSDDCADPGGGSAPLQEDPAIVRGSFPNGVSYVILPHAGSPGALVARLVMEAGSLTEPDHAPGAAAFCARLIESAVAENASGRALESMRQTYPGLAVERAVIDYETATFTVLAPSTDAGAVKLALWRLSDIAQGGALTAERLASLRVAALEEDAQCLVSQRLSRLIVPRLLPGSRLADHLPTLADDQACALSAQETIAFIASRYRAPHATLILVGDIDPKLAESLVQRIFGELPHAETAPEPARPWTAPPPGPRVIVATDPELTTFVAELTVIDLPAGPVRTECDLRRRLIDTLATRVLELRLRELIDQGAAPMTGAHVWSADIPGSMRMSAATVTGDPRHARAIIERLCREVAHARYEPVSEPRMDGAVNQAIAEAEQAAATEASADVHTIADRLTRLVRHGSALMSAPQRLAATERIVQKITPEEIADALAGRFDLDRCTLVTLAPQGPWAPSAEALRPIVEETLASIPTEPSAGPAPMALVSELPTPGDIREISLHPRAGVTSVWLSNGVRAHHRAMATRPGVVSITVTIAGGRIEETEAERGRTQATVALWRVPASRSRSASDVRRLLLGQPVHLAASIGDDAIRLTTTCAADHVDAAMQLLHLLLTEPMIEVPAFQRWRWAAIREVEQQREDPLGALRVATASALSGGVFDPRTAPLEVDEIRALQRGDVQSWIERLAHHAPLEVGIAGDLAREEALELAARYMGSLPPRSRPGAQTFCELRRPAPRPAPGVYRINAPSHSGEALALLAIRGAEPNDAASRALLDVASRLLSARLSEVCIVRERLAAQVSTQHAAAESTPGEGLLYALARSRPEQIERLAGLMNAELSRLIAGEIPEADFERARAAATMDIESRLADPAYWSWTLSDLTYRERNLDEILSKRDRTIRATARDIASALALHDAARGPDGQRLTILVSPVAPEPSLDSLATMRPMGR